MGYLSFISSQPSYNRHGESGGEKAERGSGGRGEREEAERDRSHERTKGEKREGESYRVSTDQIYISRAVLVRVPRFTA